LFARTDERARNTNHCDDGADRADQDANLRNRYTDFQNDDIDRRDRLFDCIDRRSGP